MNRFLFRAGLAALAVSFAIPAQAGVSQDFAGCDGLKKPKRSDDGMRGEASMPSFSRGKAGIPAVIMNACTRALDSGKLRPEQTLRRAHILRARAAARLELGRTAEALADLAAAEEAGREYEGEFFYERSMGVSLDLLRAIALHESGQRAEAAALAAAAAKERPFALQVQRIATVLRHANRAESGEEGNLWAQLQTIDPGSRGMLAVDEPGSTDFERLVLEAGPPALALPALPSMDELVANGGNATRFFSAWSNPVRSTMLTAYAEAATGRTDAARARIADTRQALATARDAEEKATTLAALIAQQAEKGALDPMAELIEARIAIGEGRLADAAGLLEGKSFNGGPVPTELHAAYAAAAEASVEPVPELAPLTAAPEVKTPRLAGLASEILMRPESQRKLIDYQKSRPNILGAVVGAAFSLGTSLLGGVERTAGFRSTPNDDGTVKVEYTGNTTSGPVVQEMTLLRAAELAREAGKTHFLVTRRNDYQRYLTQMQYGIPMSRTLTGYKTELTVHFLDDPGAQPALDAVAVIDALGPIYYES